MNAWAEIIIEVFSKRKQKENNLFPFVGLCERACRVLQTKTTQIKRRIECKVEYNVIRIQRQRHSFRPKKKVSRELSIFVKSTFSSTCFFLSLQNAFCSYLTPNFLRFSFLCIVIWKRNLIALILWQVVYTFKRVEHKSDVKKNGSIFRTVAKFDTLVAVAVATTLTSTTKNSQKTPWGP